MPRLLSLLVVASLVLILALPVSAGDYRVLETEHLRLVYDDLLSSFVAEYAARCFTNALTFHEQLYGYLPEDKINVGLYDYSDFGNGGATNTPRNIIIFTVAPINFVYETSPSNERINTTFNHELVHIVALDKTAGSDRFFRTIFGGKIAPDPEHPETMVYSFLTSPRYYSPRWYHEGLAVFLETWMAGGLGRAQGPYDEMVFRSMVRDSSFFYDPVGLASEASRKSFVMGVNNYLYGTRFISWLAYEYSPEKVIEWTGRTPGSKKYYGSQFKKVFGKRLDDVWQDWISWETDFQQANLDSIRQYELTPFRDISDRALGSVSRMYYDEETGELYMGVRYPGTVAYLAGLNLNTGKIRKIKDVKGPGLFYVTSLAYDPGSKTLFYTTDNDGWRSLNSVNVLNGRHKKLMHYERVGDLSFCPADSSLWGVRHFNGISTLVTIPPPYEKWRTVYVFPYGTDIYDIDISADGSQLVGSIGEISGRQTLRLFDTERLWNGDTTAVTLYRFADAVPSNFNFSSDGEYIYGSSYYTGVSNLWRWNMEADSMEVVTNVEDGMFRPLAISEDSLVAIRYTGDGFIPTLVTNPRPLEDVSATRYLGWLTMQKHPELADWLAPPPSAATVDTTYLGDYAGWKKIGITSFYPIVQGYNVRQDNGEDKSFPAVGLNFVLSDPMGHHSLKLAGTYSPASTVPSDERVHLSAEYERYDWTASFKWNPATFYDIFGPTKRSRRGYIGAIGHTRNLIYDDPREMNFNFDLSGHWDIERLPEAQNVASSSDQLYYGSVSLDYKNRRASLGAVDYEKGHTWYADVSASLVPAHGLDSLRVETEVFPAFSFDFDIGFPLPIPNSSIWLRTSQGIAPGGEGIEGSGFRGKPESNFWFGGFGNNYVDRGNVKRYRSAYAFPGVELNELGGTNYQRTMLDWNLPALRFRRVGYSSFYASYARLSIFTSGLVTNVDSDQFRTKAANLGAQIDVQFAILTNLKMTFSTGYAVAVQDDQKPSDEFMISLKIL